MDNIALIKRGSEILAALIVVVSTIVFISTTNIQNARVAAYMGTSIKIETDTGSQNTTHGKETVSSFAQEIEDKTVMQSQDSVTEESEIVADAVTAEEESLAETVVQQAEISEPVYQYVQVNALNLRSGPDSGTEKLGTLAGGTRIQILEQASEEWVRVLTPGNKEVYVFAEYVADTKPPVYNYVNVNLLNVRSGPSSDTEKLTTIERGSRVQVLEQQGEWAKIIAKDNLHGFVYAPYVVASKSLVSRAATSQPYNSGTASSIIEYAKQFAGVPYVYGGSSPKGFDCSGFTQYVYKKFKISLPRASENYSGVGTKVSRTDLKPGDILLFDRYNNHRLGHVGIYLGGDQFIHASSSLKKVVIMSLSKYNGNYLGARRVIK